MSLIVEELERLETNTKSKREDLSSAIKKNRKSKNVIIILSGVCSIGSATLLSAVVVELLPAFTMQIVSLLLALGGGLLAILSSILYRDKELHSLYSGAAEFLRLREEISHTITTLNPEIENPREVALTLDTLRKDYVNLTRLYEQYLNLDPHMGVNDAYYASIPRRASGSWSARRRN